MALVTQRSYIHKTFEMKIYNKLQSPEPISSRHFDKVMLKNQMYHKLWYLLIESYLVLKESERAWVNGKSTNASLDMSYTAVPQV